MKQGLLADYQREMEEEIEDLIDDCYVEAEETDEDYEFDACQYFDFTRPEIESEIEEAERWFEVSGYYPPSPFIVKLNLEKLLSVEVVPNSSKAKSGNTTQSSSSNPDTDSRDGVSTSKKNAKGKSSVVLLDTAKAKTKSANKIFQPKSSTLMKPTASHLGKQHKVHDKNSSHLCSRFQRISASLDRKSLQSPIGSDNLATKRQKLEIGYLRKVAQLKHQFSLLHKSTKKVTVPKEPELETLLRAQRRRSKNSCASSETERQKEKECNFKARPLNKKILQGPSLAQPKKSTPQLPEFQEFRLKTTERAKHHASAKVYPSVTDTDVVIQDAKQKLTTLKEPGLSDKLLESPPIEKFTELSLGPNTETNSASQLEKHASAKVLKKDARNSFQAEFWRCHTKPNQCGDNMRVHEVKCWSNMTRSLGIR